MFYNDIVFSSFNFKEFIDKKLNSLGIQTPEDCKQYLTNFCVHIIDALSRGRIIEWIVDSGITLNIKLWGKGWSNNEKFKPYHMGIAKHGKELASIYESSMISISDHPWSLHERNFEIMASGGFPMIIHAKHPDIDESDSITNYFRENEEVVLFYSKEDLLNKIQYYLDHPEERERIAENGRQVVINNFSHVAIAKKTMDFVKSYYLQNT
jgi:spore maturation protein CgeB